MKPVILCFDEPTSALDPELTGEVLKVIRELKNSDRTMIIVTHEMGFARSAADKVIFMADGVIEEYGTPEQVFSKPEELSAIGLSIPHAAAIAVALRKRGVALEGSIYTHEQLKAAVIRAKEAGRC